jgi:hypothetical protein
MARLAHTMNDADTERLVAWIGGEALPSADRGTNRGP